MSRANEVLFGCGHLWLDAIDLSQASDTAKAEHFGSNLGCPVVPRLIRERGPREMASRYAEVLFASLFALTRIRGIRPDIASEIDSPIKRKPSENLADFDNNWIPQRNKIIIPAPETPVGYHLPRQIVLLTREAPLNMSPVDRLDLADDLLYSTVANLGPQDHANQLLVKFGESIATKTGIDPRSILRRTISHGKMLQDNLQNRFKTIVQLMQTQAPTLYATYSKLSSDEKFGLGIAEITT